MLEGVCSIRGAEFPSGSAHTKSPNFLIAREPIKAAAPTFFRRHRFYSPQVYYYMASEFFLGRARTLKVEKNTPRRT